MPRILLSIFLAVILFACDYGDDATSIHEDGDTADSDAEAALEDGDGMPDGDGYETDGDAEDESADGDGDGDADGDGADADGDADGADGDADAACRIDTYRCDGDVLQRCNGTFYVDHVDCAETERYCDDGQCKEVVLPCWEELPTHFYAHPNGLLYRRPAARPEDPHTGWEWQEAVDYCDRLSACERSDWRMPTLDELRDLIDGCPRSETGGECGYTNDCTDFYDCGGLCGGCFDIVDTYPDACEDWPTERAWTSTVCEATAGYPTYFAINFGYGAINGFRGANGDDNDIHALCVAGETE